MSTQIYGDVCGSIKILTGSGQIFVVFMGFIIVKSCELPKMKKRGLYMAGQLKAEYLGGFRLFEFLNLV